MTLLQSILFNRCENKITEPFLPIKINQDIQPSLLDVTQDFKNFIHTHFSDFRIHNGASSLLNLPLPFQNKGERPEMSTCPTEVNKMDYSDIYDCPCIEVSYYEPDTPFSIPLQSPTYNSAKTSIVSSKRRRLSRTSSSSAEKQSKASEDKLEKAAAIQKNQKVYRKKINYDADSSSN